MALKGLKALSVRSDRSAVKLALPSMAKLKIETYKGKVSFSQISPGKSFIVLSSNMEV